MKTLYIDIYFLINLTVNLLALCFACRLSKVKTTPMRLILASAIGAVFACACALFSPGWILFSLLLAVSTFSIVLVCGGRISNLLRFKLFSSFLILETLLGGFVSFSFDLLDEHFLPIIEGAEFSAENKRLLLLSLIVLLSIGLLKVLFAVFDGKQSEICVDISFSLLGKKISVRGLVDSGNFLCDPMDLRPVILLKEALLLKYGISHDMLFSSGKNEISRKMRIIPTRGIAAQSLLYGIREDCIAIEYEKRKTEAAAVIAIDRGEGKYAGYEALIPSSLIGGLE